MEKFSKLAIVAQKAGVSEENILQSAADGKLLLSVFFEGLLLDDIGPDNMHNIQEGQELLQMATPEILNLMAQGRCVVKLGQILYVPSPKSPYKGLAQLPLDEFQELFARGRVRASCLQVGGKEYRCHEMPTSEFWNLRQDKGKMRLLCEGKTIISPEYTLYDLCITETEAEKVVVGRDIEQAPHYRKKHPYSWEEVEKKTGLSRGTIKKYAEDLVKENPENHNSKHLFSEEDLDTIIRKQKNSKKRK